MSCYENAKIYKLWSNQTDLIYIGSTCNPLSKRFYFHKNTNKYITSAELVKYEDCKIELIENYPCETKEELNAREGYWIRKENCVNKKISGRSKKEYREETKEQRKKYLEEKKEHISNVNKEYREKNKDKLNEMFNCECGGRYTYNGKSTHFKTKKHQAYLNS
jgi:hypothetical protein